MFRKQRSQHARTKKNKLCNFEQLSNISPMRNASRYPGGVFEMEKGAVFCSAFRQQWNGGRFFVLLFASNGTGGGSFVPFFACKRQKSGTKEPSPVPLKRQKKQNERTAPCIAQAKMPARFFRARKSSSPSTPQEITSPMPTVSIMNGMGSGTP